MRLSIIVPCYNEADNLKHLLARFHRALFGVRGMEVVLVNNGSNDRSAQVFHRELSEHDYRWARVVNVAANRGYGFGILTGLQKARGEYLGWTHADLQTPPETVVEGFERMMRQACPERCFLRGRRRRRSAFDGIFTAGMSVVASMVLQSKLSDINAQPKIFHRSFLSCLSCPPHDFSLDLYALFRARQSGLTLIEIPVDFGRRVHGVAKGGGTLRGKIRLTAKTLRFLYHLRRGLRHNISSSATGWPAPLAA